MQPQSNEALVHIRDVLLETYLVNDAMNQLLLAHLDPRAWRAQPPGAGGGSARTIASIFAHLHNNRLTWLRNSAPHLKCPARLDPDRCSMKQAAAAHTKSARRCLRMLTDALSDQPKFAKLTREPEAVYRGCVCSSMTPCPRIKMSRSAEDPEG